MLYEAIVTIDEVSFLISERADHDGFNISVDIGNEEACFISADYITSKGVFELPYDFSDYEATFKLAFAALLNDSFNLGNERMNELNAEIQTISEDPHKINDVIDIGNVDEFIASAAA